MKANSQFLSKLSIVILLLFLACNKSNDSQNDSSTFTWTWNGTNYTANFKEAFLLNFDSFILGGTGISVYSSGTGPRIIVSSFNVGSYNLGSTVPNYIEFVDPNGYSLSSTGGSLNITLNSNNKLSGNFSATLTNGTSQTTLNGSFSNIKINL